MSLLSLQANAFERIGIPQVALQATSVNQAHYSAGITREEIIRVLDEALRILDEDDDEDLFQPRNPSFSRHLGGGRGSPFAQ